MLNNKIKGKIKYILGKGVIRIMYIIKNTERNNQTASEYETKSLLYLMSMRKDSSEIEVFIIDCFNDVSGSNQSLDKIWDLQSKGVASLNPKKIGCALITLYENYISDINFSDYILFMPKLKEGYLKDESLNVYDIDNFITKKVNNIANGLFDEYKRRHELEDVVKADIVCINEFLKYVTFVIAESEKSYYIKNIIDFKNKEIINREFLSEIFDEIRDKQTVLKNIAIEGIKINKPVEILQYNKTMRKSKIEMLVIDRLVGTQIFDNKGIRPSFIDEIREMDEEDIKDLIQECNSNISRTLFNKNTKEGFWSLLENMIKIIDNNRKLNLDGIYQLIPDKIINKVHTLDQMSIKYFISLIKDGVRNED